MLKKSILDFIVNNSANREEVSNIMKKTLSYFDKINNKGFMINLEKVHSMLSYLVIKVNNILCFIPLSTKVDKYKMIINNKIKKHGNCRSILVKKIGGVEQVILIQNAFLTMLKVNIF